jgi:hypothetical protein
VTEIRSLLDRSAKGGFPPRDLVEHTLTNGYAHALGLEQERLRIERRLRVLVRGAEHGRPGKRDADDLTRRLAAADRELTDLRSLLSSLRSSAL